MYNVYVGQDQTTYPILNANYKSYWLSKASEFCRVKKESGKQNRKIILF